MTDDLDDSNLPKRKAKQMPLAYSFNVQTPNQLIEIMTEQDVYLPMDIALNQMANIRLIILTCRLREIPFDIIRIDDYWFVDKVLRSDLSDYLKPGDRLLIIDKTMISNQLNEVEIFKLILHSSIPFIIWVTWDADTYLTHRAVVREHENEVAHVDAKAYLLRTRHYDQISLYDHLAYMIANAIQNPYDNSSRKTVVMEIGELFEKLNQNTQYPIIRSDLRPAKDTTELTMVKIHAQLLEGKEREVLKSKDYLIKAVPSMMDMAYHCSSAGFGLHMTEIILLWSAMKRLNNQINCTDMKFWGKIFGLHCDYYVIQVEHEVEIPFDQIDITDDKTFSTASKQSKYQVQTNTNPEEILSADIPSEMHGTGPNQYTYFVTNSPGLPWMKLPDVKPMLITQARRTRCLFTGCLSAPVKSCPPYPGLERDYLRAQIARISATTRISPVGFYMLSEIEGEEEGMSVLNEQKGTTTPLNQSILTERILEASVIPNPEFNSDPTNLITADLLANANLQEWVHSQPEILPQGRTHFWQPLSPGTTTVNDDEESLDEGTIEIPAPLLQPIGDDKVLHTDQPSWTIGLSMSVMHEYSVCYVRSNLWPGAFTLGHVGGYLNLYLGWGQKYESFKPFEPPAPELEFGREFFEKNDPTVEQESAVEEARREAALEVTSEEYQSTDENTEEQLTDEEY